MVWKAQDHPLRYRAEGTGRGSHTRAVLGHRSTRAIWKRPRRCCRSWRH